MYENKIKEIDKIQKEINSFRPLGKHELQELKEYFCIGLTYSSNALEGNSLTETETKIVIEDGITIGGKTLRDHFEAVGHSNAYDFMYGLAKEKTISEKDILEFHRLFYYRINEESAGKYRKEQVFISGSTFIPPSPKYVPQLMHGFASHIVNLETRKHPVEYAALLHKEFVEIHPFIDGNGRTARLLMNLALLQHGYVITIIPPVLRHDYINAIVQSQADVKDDAPFINFISCMVYESQKDYLRLLEGLVR
ncbi:Fic family protein [Candidatus Dependentiae bacterium]